MPQPIISVFGGGRVERDSTYARMVHEFAAICARNGYSVLTGGGPGAMEAANCGAHDVIARENGKVKTLGVGVYGVDDTFVNPCATVIKVSEFSTRKDLLMRYSCAFVAFPGGIGTMDEVFDLLNRAKHLRIKRIPVVLVDSVYWHNLMEWYHDAGLEQGLIGPSYKGLLISVDTPQQAFDVIRASLDRSDGPPEPAGNNMR